MANDVSRRDVIRKGAIVTAGMAVAATSPSWAQAAKAAGQKQEKEKEEEKEGQEVTATEDLMREHGVLRRALLVYDEMADKIRANPAAVETQHLRQAAELFRSFGEEYHESTLEEKHIFPIVRKTRGVAAKYPDVLEAQHKRGREVTAYILSVAKGNRIATQHAEPLARVLHGFVRMYENHAAREDTIVFPAWKTNFSNSQLDELAEQFEEIEHKMFGADGFADAEQTISTIEEAYGLSDISQFTVPSPPRVR